MVFSRRTFLKISGLTGALVAAPRPGAGAPSGEDPEPAEGATADG